MMFTFTFEYQFPIQYLFPILLPLISAVVLYFPARRFRQYDDKFNRDLARLSTGITFANCFVFILLFVCRRPHDLVSSIKVFKLYAAGPSSWEDPTLLIFEFIPADLSITCSYELLYDALTIMMVVVVLVVSAMVQLFSLEYMSNDYNIREFFGLLNFFTFCMLTLVTAGGFITMFVGWEGVGVSSFLLIGFWFSRAQAAKCAAKAIIINRIGDCSLLLAFSLIGFAFGDFSYINFYSAIESGTYYHNSDLLCLQHAAWQSSLSNYFIFHKIIYLFNFSFDLLFLIGLLILIGAFSKSAQFGLHTWLPDAMEGPTPVSALIHAATMVTAGVFLIIRCSSLFLLNNDLSTLLLIFGSITALFGASVASAQFDIKKIIAYSTCSQLGYMIAACGASKFDLAFFHLSAHAFFKAGLFLCAGLIIHALGDEQDIRKMGGLIRLMPITYLSFLICSMCLGGIPFFSGFYSKDAIIEGVFSYDLIGRFSFSVLILSAFLTIFYSVRLFYYVFWRNYYAGSRSRTFLIHETIASSCAVLFLSSISIFFGFYWVSGGFSSYFEKNLGSSLNFRLLHFTHTLFWENSRFSFGFVDSFPSFPQILPSAIFFSLVSVILFSVFFIFFDNVGVVLNTRPYGRHIYNFFAKAWLYDIFLTKIARLAFYFFKIVIQRNIESGLFEYGLVLAPIRSLSSLNNTLMSWADGTLSTYIKITVFGALFILFSFLGILLVYLV